MTDDNPYVGSTNERLNILSLFHYIVGALHFLFGSVFFIHVFMGILFLTKRSRFGTDSPPLLGMLLLVFGASAVLFGWGLGLATVLSGLKIKRRTARVFSLIVGAVNCVALPLGTALGIFTIIVLTNATTRSIYGEPADFGGQPRP